MIQSKVITDWINFKDVKYRRIGETMEVALFKMFFEEPKEQHLSCDIPCGLKGAEIAPPQSLTKFHKDVVFMGVILPDHWTIHTRRMFKIDGWSNNVVMCEDVK